MNKNLSTNITGGYFRGRRIITPSTSATHPMGSREKIALFNMLMPYLENATIIDAFAGSGALGLEALSRGAKSVVFVDNNIKAATAIKQNINSLGVASCAKVEKIPISKLILNQKFDIVIADPPYDNFNQSDIEVLADYLQENGILVLSHPSVLVELKGLKLLKKRSYAAANISLFQKI